jgi:acyl carrier protein
MQNDVLATEARADLESKPPADSLVAAVSSVLIHICEDYARDVDVRLESSLVHDLGFDSLMFVDLTVMLEERLGIEEFPMRAWADAERARENGRGYTFQSLLCACAEALQGAELPVHDRTRSSAG